MSKKLFRTAALFVAAAMCFSMTACQVNKTSSDDTSTVYVEEDGLSIGKADNQNSSGSNNTSGGSSAAGGSTAAGKDKVTIGQEITIASGQKGMEAGLDFGGKTFTMAVDENDAFNTTSFNATISAFEKKHNCKINKKAISFSQYNSLVSQQMSTGKSYDILYFHGSMFPEFAINNLAEDLSGLITTADLVGSDPSKGGIDLEKSQNFVWNGKLYALCDYKAQNPLIFYYNKALFKQYGLEDPRKLYDTGKWTWDKVFEMGAQVTDRSASQYFLSGMFTTQFYGVSVLSIDNGKVVERLTNPTYYKALTLYKKIFDTVCEPWVNNVPVKNGFYEGKTFIYSEESSKWPEICPEVKKSYAFNKDTSNLGIVPVPLPPENTAKLYPCGWYTGIAAGKGSDARVAVAWAKFASSFVSPIKDKYPMTDNDEQLIKKLRIGKILSNRHGSYSTTTKNTTNLTELVLTNIRKGEDIATTIANIHPQIIACIEATVGKNNYVSK